VLAEALLLVEALVLAEALEANNKKNLKRVQRVSEENQRGKNSFQAPARKIKPKY
jgi:hypothetical protein